MNEKDRIRAWTSAVVSVWKRMFDYRGTASRFQLTCWAVFCLASFVLGATFLPHFVGKHSFVWYWLSMFSSTYAWNVVPDSLRAEAQSSASLPIFAYVLTLLLPSVSLIARRLREAAHSPWHAAWFPLLLFSWSLFPLLHDAGMSSIYDGGVWVPYIGSAMEWLTSLASTGTILCAVFVCSRAGSGMKIPLAESSKGWFRSLRRSLSLYACFRGRSSRREWWTWFWCAGAGAILMAGLTWGIVPPCVWKIMGIVSPVVVWLTPAFWALCVRRLHDIGRSSRLFTVWLCIPLLGSWVEKAVFMVFGDDFIMEGEQIEALVSTALLAFPLLLAVHLAVWIPAWIVAAKWGDPSPNKYGAPLQRESRQGDG